MVFSDFTFPFNFLSNYFLIDINQRYYLHQFASNIHLVLPSVTQQLLFVLAFSCPSLICDDPSSCTNTGAHSTCMGRCTLHYFPWQEPTSANLHLSRSQQVKEREKMLQLTCYCFNQTTHPHTTSIPSSPPPLVWTYFHPSFVFVFL